MERNDNKKIFYVYYGRFPSEKAHALFAAKTCEAFSKLGFEVTLIAPGFGKHRKKVNEYFSVEDNFAIEYIDGIDFRGYKFLKKQVFFLGRISFMLRAATFIKGKRGALVYTNEEWMIPFKPKDVKLCYELHDFPEQLHWLRNLLYKKADHILTTNKWKQERFTEVFPQHADKTFVELNAVEIEKFDIAMTKEGARQKLGIEADRNIILYTGHLFSWKGVDTLAEAAKLLSDEFLVYFVGGTKKDVERFKSKYGEVENIRIVGYRPHDEIPVWQKTADVLVLPNTAKEDISKYYTSPMKLFEYMASNVPIIASSLPSVAEVVSENEVFFVKPDDPGVLAKKIADCLVADEDVQMKKIKNAYQKVQNWTWEKRAARISAVLKL